MFKNYALEDLSGTKLDFLEILKKEKCSPNGHARYLCRCDCGKEFVKRKDCILKMRVKSCGCKTARKKPTPNPKPPKREDKTMHSLKKKDHSDLSGQRFGRLLVLEFVGSDKHHKRLYRCVCDCGNEKITTQAILKRGEAVSCGCYHKEIVYTKNGLTAKRIYHVWYSMRLRCYNKILNNIKIMVVVVLKFVMNGLAKMDLKTL